MRDRARTLTPLYTIEYQFRNTPGPCKAPASTHQLFNDFEYIKVYSQLCEFIALLSASIFVFEMTEPRKTAEQKYALLTQHCLNSLKSQC